MHYMDLIMNLRFACILFSLVVSQDKVWRDQFYDGHPNKERGIECTFKRSFTLLYRKHLTVVCNEPSDQLTNREFEFFD